MATSKPLKQQKIKQDQKYQPFFNEFDCNDFAMIEEIKEYILWRKFRQNKSS